MRPDSAMNDPAMNDPAGIAGKPGAGPASALAEWRAHWPVVLVGALGMMMVSCNLYSLGTFVKPLQEEFGWSRAQITGGHLITTMLAVVIGPLIGLMVDRHGPRRVAIPGTFAFCLALAGLSLAGPSIWSWWLLWGLVAVVTLAVSPAVWTTGVTRAFSRSRGLALAVTLSGTGIGLALAPNFTTLLIRLHGWRVAYVGLAAALAVIVVPAIILLLRVPPRGGVADRNAAHSRAFTLAPSTGWRALLLDPRFLKLAFTTLAFAMGAMSFTINLVPILMSTGQTAQGAAGLSAVIGLASVTGRLSNGWLLDRFDGNKVGAVSVAFPVLGCLCFVLAPGSTAMVVAGTFAIGLAMGGEYDVIAYLASRHLGTRDFATVFAILNGLLGLAGGIGPILFSRVYDVTGSYMPALWASIPLYLAAASALLLLGPFREEAAEPGDSALESELRAAAAGAL
ncbi:MFS transporter [Novosphingobium bradum]|uniref:MFS transporter n=1 Tax=Novosphingobium bradum TaxID=1737444 RepID=A0ABV7IJ63_9SPHN